jgi:hypothetical protein
MQMESRAELPAEETALRARVSQRMALLNGLDPVIHQPTRLRLMALLAWSQDALRFQVLAEQLHLSKSLLSGHLTTLHRAGFFDGCAVAGVVVFGAIGAALLGNLCTLLRTIVEAVLVTLAVVAFFDWLGLTALAGLH